MVENFKGEHRVHTDMRLRQQGRAHIDSTKKREGRTENIHITYTQRGGQAANTVNNNILHSCCVSASERASWQADKRRRSRGALGVRRGTLAVGVFCGGLSQVSGVSGLRGPSHGHPIHLLPGPGQKAGALGLHRATDRPGNTRRS